MRGLAEALSEVNVIPACASLVGGFVTACHHCVMSYKYKKKIAFLVSNSILKAELCIRKHFKSYLKYEL